jgi:hypothetical protein
MRYKYIKRKLPATRFSLKEILHPFFNLSQGKDYLKFYPLYGKEEFNRYRIDAPDFIHVWDSTTDFLLKFVKGVQLRYNTIRLNISGLIFDPYFIKDKSSFCLPLNEVEDMESSYYTELYALRLSFPENFLLPFQFRTVEVSPLYDTFDPKRRRRRSKYRTSKHYKNWLVYSQRYNDLIAYFMPAHNKEFLAAKKSLFELTPTFDVSTYMPRTRIEALYFFLVFGPPAKDCKDKKKAMLFLSIFLSGNYLKHSAPASFSRVLVYRNILMNHAIDSAFYYQRLEQFIVPSKGLNEIEFLYRIRLLYLKIIHFFSTFTDRARIYWSQRKNYLSSLMGLWRNRMRFWFKFYFSESWGIVRSEASFSFYRNPSSFLWSMSPNTFKVVVMTWYMAGIEILHDNRTEKYFDSTWTDPSDAFTETWVDKLLDTFRFFYYDCIRYPVMLVIRPWVELFLVFPVLFFLESLFHILVNFLILTNNLWYGLLMVGSSLHTSTKGWWWKSLLIYIKIVTKLLLFFLFIYIFVFIVDFDKVCNLLFLNDFSLFNFRRGEGFIIYISFIIYIAFLLFGSYTIREFLWLETGPSHMTALLVSYILWTWRVDPTLPIHIYYPSSWLEFSSLEVEGDFTYDRTTAVSARYDWLSSADAAPSRKYSHKSFNWRVGHTGVALGSEVDLIQEFKISNS